MPTCEVSCACAGMLVRVQSMCSAWATIPAVESILLFCSRASVWQHSETDAGSLRASLEVHVLGRLSARDCKGAVLGPRRGWCRSRSWGRWLCSWCACAASVAVSLLLGLRAAGLIDPVYVISLHGLEHGLGGGEARHEGAEQRQNLHGRANTEASAVHTCKSHA